MLCNKGAMIKNILYQYALPIFGFNQNFCFSEKYMLTYLKQESTNKTKQFYIYMLGIIKAVQIINEHVVSVSGLVTKKSL